MIIITAAGQRAKTDSPASLEFADFKDEPTLGIMIRAPSGALRRRGASRRRVNASEGAPEGARCTERARERRGRQQLLLQIRRCSTKRERER